MGEDFSEMEDFSDIEDFSDMEEPVEEYKIGIFWDVEACPFPDGMDPDLIYQKIDSALIERGARGEMSIWAYVDKKKVCWDEFLRKKTWKARLYFLPRGDKPSLRMLNDTLLWRMKSPAPATLIVVSDKVRHTTLYTRLKIAVGWRYAVYIVEPTGYVSPESLEWPGSLLDHQFTFPSIRESEEVNPAKRREVGEGSKDQSEEVNPAKRRAVGEGSKDQG